MGAAVPAAGGAAAVGTAVTPLGPQPVPEVLGGQGTLQAEGQGGQEEERLGGRQRRTAAAGRWERLLLLLRYRRSGHGGGSGDGVGGGGGGGAACPARARLPPPCSAPGNRQQGRGEGKRKRKRGGGGRVVRLWLFFLRKEERDGLRVWVAVGSGKWCSEGMRRRVC